MAKPRVTFIPLSSVERDKLRKRELPGLKSGVVVRDVCARHGVPPALLISEYRNKELSHARGEVAFVLREYVGMSFPKIAKILGNRHPTTIRTCAIAHARRNGLSVTSGMISGKNG